MKIQRKLKLCFTGDMSNVHCQRHVNFFVDRGHEVHIVDDHKYKYKNLKMHYLKNFTGIKIVDYLLRLIQAKNTIRKINPDLIFSQQVTYHGFIGALSGIHPFVISPWGSDVLYDPGKSSIYRKIIKFVFDSADCIHYIDQSMIDRVNQIYGSAKNRGFLLNEGTNTKIFKKNKKRKKNKLSIICLRTLSHSYNPILLIKALNVIVNKRKNKNVQVIMCGTVNYGGNPSYKKNVVKLIKKHNLSNNVKFFKWVKDITYSKKLMEDADIYVDTINRPVKGQGTGKTALEAMSSELAMVMPNNPSIELYIKHMKNGIIYKRDNEKSLAEALSTLIKNKSLRSKLGQNARKFIIANLDWDKNMEKMEQKYYELVRKKQGK